MYEISLIESFDYFGSYLRSLAKRRRSCLRLMAYFKELLDEIARLCQRTKPSKRDSILLKDLPTLVNQIVKQPNPSAKIA